MKVEDGCERRDLQPIKGRDAGDASAWCDWVGGERLILDWADY